MINYFSQIIALNFCRIVPLEWIIKFGKYSPLTINNLTIFRPNRSLFMDNFAAIDFA